MVIMRDTGKGGRVIVPESRKFGFILSFLSDEQSANAQDYNFDHPDSFNTELLLSCVETLKKRLPANIPAYDYKIHKNNGIKPQI
ncbi:hypothetical protein L2E82_50323 [Cichorium intybus]|nr:hypothetical protein L2E82_50323 [Cichorium intybus]